MWLKESLKSDRRGGRNGREWCYKNVERKKKRIIFNYDVKEKVLMKIEGCVKLKP